MKLMVSLLLVFENVEFVIKDYNLRSVNDVLLLHYSFQTDGSVPNTLVIANCEIVKPRVAAAEHISQVISYWRE